MVLYGRDPDQIKLRTNANPTTNTTHVIVNILQNFINFFEYMTRETIKHIIIGSRKKVILDNPPTYDIHPANIDSGI